ncbi:riboflavin synthase [Bacillus coahuilensis]|uniref:riboflavin synthase n=1 Tax=Bacillus coahuilensis TaxID=408580 RepID=UPI000AC74221
MFTGIIEEIGTIQSISRSSKSLQLTIQCQHILDDIHIGDSISVNGVCLTVTYYSTSSFQADVIPETFSHTSLKQLTLGSRVNLERAMSARGRFGGHIVSGHVDGIGKIVKKQKVDIAEYVEIEISHYMLPFFIDKGSIAVDGTSLTVFQVDDLHSTVTISLIPQTQSDTILNDKRIGDEVNIECDMLAKYIFRFNQIGNKKIRSR